MAQGGIAPILVGPASPRDLADLLTGSDRARAYELAGYRGIPVSELARALINAGLQVEIATAAHEVEAPLTLQGNDLQLHVTPRRPRARDRALDGFRLERHWLTSVIRRSSANVAHAHWTYEFAWAALDSGLPTVVTAHDAPVTILRHSPDPYRAIRTAMAYLMRFRIRTLTAVAPYLAGRWRREMFYGKPIRVIPNSSPALPPVSRAPKSGERVLDISDSGPRKNVVALFRAFELLRESRAEAQLDLVGPGLAPGDPLPLALAREGSCDGIRFLGRVDRHELAEALDRAHVFAHPSREESCPTSVLEAMRARVPVVAGERSGGVPWMLGYGSAGMLVDIEDPAAIARALGALLDDHTHARALGERGRRRAEECFSSSVVASAYIDSYEHVLTMGHE